MNTRHSDFTALSTSFPNSLRYLHLLKSFVLISSKNSLFTLTETCLMPHFKHVITANYPTGEILTAAISKWRLTFNPRNDSMTTADEFVTRARDAIMWLVTNAVYESSSSLSHCLLFLSCSLNNELKALISSRWHWTLPPFLLPAQLFSLKPLRFKHSFTSFSASFFVLSCHLFPTVTWWIPGSSEWFVATS